MHRNQFEKEWYKIKSNIQDKWNKLSDDDIDEIDGQYNQFINKIQHKYGYSRQQAENEIQNWKMEESESEESEEQSFNPRSEQNKKEGQRGWEGENRNPRSEQQKREELKPNKDQTPDWKKKRKAG